MRFSLIDPEISIRESRGFVKDVYDPVVRVREPLSDYQVMLSLIHSDPTIARAFDIVTDFATHRGFDFIGGKKEQRDSLRRQFMTSLNFQQVLPNILYSLDYYGDAFLELRRKDSVVPNELWPLETTEMRIAYDIHGTVEQYVQRPFSLAGLTEEEILSKEEKMGVYFDPKEVIHFRRKWIGSQIYSYNLLEPASTQISAKMYASNYLMNIFINMPPRYAVHLAGIGRKELSEARAEFRSAKTNYRKTIAFSRSSDPSSKLQMQKIDPPYDKELLEVIKYLRQEVLTQTGVPMSWLEESGAENRGITESEQRPFDVMIQALHRNVLEPPINNKLLPALGHSKVPVGGNQKLMLRFNEISRKGEKEILENAERLTNMGLKPDALVRYLDERGILGLDPNDFDIDRLTKDKDIMPSRAREDKNVSDMKSNLNEAGVSDSSGKKIDTRSLWVI